MQHQQDIVSPGFHLDALGKPCEQFCTGTSRASHPDVCVKELQALGPWHKRVSASKNVDPDTKRLMMQALLVSPRSCGTSRSLASWAWVICVVGGPTHSPLWLCRREGGKLSGGPGQSPVQLSTPAGCCTSWN